MHGIVDQFRGDCTSNLLTGFLSRSREQQIVSVVGAVALGAARAPGAVELVADDLLLRLDGHLGRQVLVEAALGGDALDRFEVLDGLDLQLERRVLIDHDHRVLVQLQRRQRPHVVDAVLDAALQRERLVRARDNNDDLARVQDGGDADGQRHARHFAEVVAEEARVGEDGVVGQCLDPRARLQARARLVECDVPVRPDPSQE